VLGLVLCAAPAVGQTPVPGGGPAAAPPSLQESLPALDKNADRRIDREEFHRFAVESFFFRDRDRNGDLTVDELRAADPRAFASADRNGDGRLSLEEYANALHIDFQRADVDGDGILTYQEIEIYVRITTR
jgi:hypothetical protein